MGVNLKVSFFMFVLFCACGGLILSSFSFLQHYDLNTGASFHIINNHDGIWHLALMESLQHGIPPNNPLITGEKLFGYHYLNDEIVVLLHSFTGIPLPTLFLKIMPVALAILFSATTLLLFLSVIHSKTLAYLGAILTVFGANFAYLVPIFSPLSKADQSAFWLDQTIHLGVNQQLLFSLSIANIMYFLFSCNVKKYWWLIGVLTGLLVAIKIYGAMLLLPALGLIGAWQLFQKKEWHTLGSVIIATAITIPLLKLIGNKNGFPFFLEPGWFFRTMFESGDRLNLPYWEVMRETAIKRHDILRQIFLWVVAIVIFFAGNFGIKILGVLSLPRLSKNLLFFLVVAESFCVVSFFLQKGVAWNTIQFLPYAQVPLGILFVDFIAHTFPHPKTQVLLVVVGIILMLPSTVQTFLSDLKPTSYITHPASEITGLEQLRTTRLDKELIVGSSLYGNSLVPAFSGQPVYWADDGVLTVINDLHLERKKFVEDVEAGHALCSSNQVLIEEDENGIHVLPCPLTSLPYMCRTQHILSWMR